jgi:putative hydrolase of the HAD superfamily
MIANINSSIKAIIFDLGNVIVDFDHFIICRKLAEYSNYSPEQVKEKIFTSGLEEQFDRGQISPETFFKAISKELNIDIDIALFRKIWNNIFSLNAGIEQLIKRLQGKYKLLCLSNTNPWHFEFCMQTFPVLNNFDSFILSFKVGEKKPHKKIFQKATEEANALPWECLYIDDIKKFVKAAEDRGIKGIHFISAEQLEKELEVFGVL